MGPLIQGALLGASIAAPVGPVSLLCVRQSLARGYPLGLLSGLGAALAHAVYATVALCGAGGIASLLAAWRPELRVLSVVALLVIGVRTALRPSASRSAGGSSKRLYAFASTLGLALLNPMTILPYIAAAATFGAKADAVGAIVWMVPGASLGAAAWYATMSGVACLIRPGLLAVILPRLNAAAGVALVGFGIAAAFR